MNRAYSFIIMCCLAVSCYAQTQPGYVKTQGRPNKPGVPLANVTIRMKGLVNAVISGTDGKFNVPFPGKKNGDAISLLSVRKNGYELIDPEMEGRSLVFNTNVAIEIVMVSTTELEANRKRISDNAYRKAEENYQLKLKQLEQQVAESKITEEKYFQELKELQDRYDKYRDLIDGMADRYARTDYDHLDSIDREINICIEEGELEKADSLIHTVFDPTTVLERNRAAKAEVEAKMKLAQEIIDRASEGMDTLRRDSDTLKRVMILCDNLAAEFIAQGESAKARDCLMQSLRIRQLLYGEESEEVRVVKEKLAEIE